MMKAPSRMERAPNALVTQASLSLHGRPVGSLFLPQSNDMDLGQTWIGGSTDLRCEWLFVFVRYT